MKNSNWNNDLQFEKIITEFLNTKTNVFKELGVKKIIGDNLTEQRKGVDLILDNKFKVANCDIKSIAQLNFDTFCFEIQGISREKGKSQVGWLLNKELETDCYLLTWNSVKNGTGKYWEDKNIANINNIEEMDIFLIGKEDLIKFINSGKNIQLEKIVEEINKYSYTPGENSYFFIKDNNLIKTDWSIRRKCLNRNEGIDFYITQSNKIAERPINIVISKEKLGEISIKKWKVKNEN